MNSPFFSPTTKALFAGVFALCLAATAGATTYYFGPTTWADYSKPENWYLDRSLTTPADSIPGSSDSLCAYTVPYFDCGGNEYEIGSLDWGTSGWSYQIHIRNGGLLFTGNPSPHYWGFQVESPNGSLRFKAGTTFTPGYNDGSSFVIRVHDSGMFTFTNATFNIHHFELDNRSGATTYFAPSAFGVTAHNFDAPFNNAAGATLTLPNGLVCTKGQNGHIKLTNSGTLNIGGPLSFGNTTTKFTVTLSGGTVNVTGNVSTKVTAATFSGTTTMNFVNGARFDATDFSTANGAALNLAGSGIIAISTNHPAISVGVGSAVEPRAFDAVDLSTITFAQGGRLRLANAGVVITNWNSSLSSADFEIGYAPASGATVLTIADATLLAQARTGINASLAGTGISVEISGNSLVAESHYTFNSSTVTDLNDVNGWVNQLAAPADQPAIISGSGTAAVMDETVPAYSAISVADGASLTIAAERSIPATTLAAGTTFNVARSLNTTQEMTFSGYVMTTDTFVGTMDPAKSITDLTNISGLIGGSAWASDLKGTPYSRVDVSTIENGTKLCVQFKQWESNASGSYMKCVVIELRKDAEGGIYAKAVKAAYRQNQPDYDFDFSGSSGYTTANIATSDSAGNYGVKDLSFTVPVEAGATYALQSYSGVLPLSATAVGTMDSTASITSLTDFTGEMAGSWSGHGAVQATLAKSLDNGASLLVQFKAIDGSYVKCAIVRFTQADGTIYAQTVAARYLTGQDLAHDFINADGTYNETQATPVENDADEGYGVTALSFRAPSSSSANASTVTATGDFATTGSGTVTVDVAEGCVLNLSGVDVTTAATLVKTGPGTIVFGDELPTALNVTAGVLAVQPYVEYDTNGVTVAAAATVEVAIDGTYKPAFPVAGRNNTVIFMTGYTYIGVGGWNTLANWVCGELPDISDTAHVYGTNTVLTLDAVPATIPGAIVVEAGATLSLATDFTPPMLTLDKEATLEVASGTTTLAHSLIGIVLVDGDNVTLPALVVRDGATLSVPGDMKFSNVDISLYGTISVSTLGTLTFGHAPLNETTYIGLYAEGAKIRLSSSGSNYDVRRIGICCPEVGGCVVAVRDIVFKDMPTIGTHFPSYDYPDGFHLGVNNPADEAFEVVFDNTKWGVDGNFYVWGGATFRMKNGSSFMNREDYGYYNRHAGVKENGRIIVGAGCELRLNAMGNGGVTPFDVTVQETGHKAVTVADGGIFETFRWGGNNKGVFASSNGVVRIYNPRYDDVGNNWHYVNVLFDKLSAVALAPDSLLTFTTRNGSSSRGFKDASGPRVVAMADVPIIGNGGSITLSNANVNAFGVVVRSASNTATGTAGVSPAEAGMGDTTLYFASGANWAGTVVAGDVALTNLTDGAAAATVNFEALDLAGDFPVRVWKENGVITSDTVNIGQYVNHGGKLIPALLTDGASFAPGDKVTVGLIDASSPLPATGRGWRCKLVDNGLDNDTKTLILSNSRGLQIMLQ